MGTAAPLSRTCSCLAEAYSQSVCILCRGCSWLLWGPLLLLSTAGYCHPACPDARPTPPAQAADHIGVSVLRVFHAVIALADAPSSYIPDVAAATWAPSADTAAAGGAPPPITVGTTLLLSVLDTRHTPAGLFHVRGSLSAPGAGVLPDEDGTADELDWDEADDGPESQAGGRWVSDAYASFAAEVGTPRPPARGKELPKPASTTRGKRRERVGAEKVVGDGNIDSGGSDDGDGSGGMTDDDGADCASAAEALAMEGVGPGGEGGWGDALAELGGGHSGAGNE